MYKKLILLMSLFLCISVSYIHADGDSHDEYCHGSVINGELVYVCDEISNADINYHVDSSYQWQIHTTIDFGSNAGVNHTVNRTAELSDDTQVGVRVNKNVIPDRTNLVISLDDSNTFRVVNGNTSLGYTVAKTSGGTALAASDSVLEVAAGTNTGSQALYFTLSTSTGAAEVAGTYNGTITYNAEIASIPYIPGLYQNGSLVMDWQELIDENIIKINSSNKYEFGTGSKSLIDGELLLDGTYPYVSGTFAGCVNLTSITFPEGMLTIPSGFCSGCENLTEINFSSTIETIESSVFDGTSITSIEIPGTVTSMGSGIFSNCTDLTTIIFGEGITTIPVAVCNGCTSLTSVTLPSTTQIIDYSAFGNATSLNLITIPSSVTTINSGAFSSCSSLIAVIFENPTGWTCPGNPDFSNPTEIAAKLKTGIGAYKN